MLVSWSIGCRGQTAQAGPTVREPAVAGGEPVPPGIDVTKPNIARVYDSFLDGKDNFAADRAVVKLTLEIAPDAAWPANRAERVVAGSPRRGDGHDPRCRA